MAHHIETVRVDISLDDTDCPRHKMLTVHKRRLEENLPIFGRLVEHADQTELRYHEREDARNIELFFDLFFVAIFSTFTKNHEINSRQALSSYVVYFGVIWATWLQVCLFDVRFGYDSIFERFTKAVQMCAFIGFASATGCLQMDPKAVLKKKPELSGFGALNVLMIISRALFSMQYAVALVLVGRKHKPAQKPLWITSGVYMLAAIIYGLLFRFVIADMTTGKMSGFYGYYAVIAFELVAMSVIVYQHPCVSFRGTHIHKRLMVLTLMILGEGIIVCAFSFAKISSKTGWTANSFGQALCVILSIYFIYCLYFGNSGIEHAGAFLPGKQQVYTMLHLPFHLCLALTLEGLRTWVVIANVQYNFNKIYGYIDKMIGKSPDIFRLEEFNGTTGAKIVKTLNQTVVSYGFDSSNSWPFLQNALNKLQLVWNDDTATIEAGVPGLAAAGNKGAILKFYFNEFVSLFQNEQFVANSLVVPDVQVQAARGSGKAEMDAYFEVFKMIFIYFFICTAFLIFLLGLFRSMSIGPSDRYDRIVIIVRMASGFMLAMLALLALMDSYITKYINSGVLLPTLLFVLIFVVFFEKATTIFAIRRGHGHIAQSYEGCDYEDEEAATLHEKGGHRKDSWVDHSYEEVKQG